MCQVGFVANDDGLMKSIGRALCEVTQCTVFSLSDPEQKLLAPEHFKPTLFIIEYPSTLSSVRHWVDGLRCHYPEALIISVVPEESWEAVAGLLSHRVDEVMRRPGNEAFTCHLIEQISHCINTLDRIATLQETLRQQMGECQIVAKSKPMRFIMQQLPKLGNSSSTVLITGETGVGKELIARAIHYLGPRAGQPFVTVDCGAIPEHLVENELFGHVRGAYTDAASSSRGLIQEAGGGTLFLDEVEALPLAVQAKFLRFLQDRQYRPLGHSKYLSAEVRVLAATNLNLAEAVEQKNFRADLYYRLNVIPLLVPPLRERRADIPALVRCFLSRHGGSASSATHLPDEIMQDWVTYDWPGNVRELENKVQVWVADVLAGAHDFAPRAPRTSARLSTLKQIRQEAVTRCERIYLTDLMVETKGNLSAAARVAAVDRKNLRLLLRKHGMNPLHYRQPS